MGKNTYQRVVDLLNEHIPAKVSRNEFCRITGINRNSVDRYRAGLGCPIEETLQKMSKYFGIPVSVLRGKTDDDNEEMSREVFLTSCKKYKGLLSEFRIIPDNEKPDAIQFLEWIYDEMFFDQLKKENDERIATRYFSSSTLDQNESQNNKPAT